MRIKEAKANSGLGLQPGLLLTFALISLAAVGWFNYRAVQTAADANRWENHSYVEIDQLVKVFSTLQDAESGQRGYLITGNREYLESYEQALGRLGEQLNALRTLAQDNPRAQARLDRIEPLIGRKLDVIKRNVDLRATKGPEAAFESVRTGPGKELMDEIRVLIAQAQDDENRLLQQRSAAYNLSATRLFNFQLAGAILAGVLLIGAFALLKRQILVRHRMEIEARKVKDQLAAELAAMNRLHDLGTRFMQQEDQQTLLKAILDAAIAIAGASKGNIQLLDPTSEELGIAVHCGFDETFVDYFSHILAGQAACGTAMKTRQCVVVEDITTSPIFLAQPQAMQIKLAAGVRALICTPLLTQASHLVGVLSVHFQNPHHPSDRDLRLLDLLSRQAADFIERKRAGEKLLQERNFSAAALNSLPGIFYLIDHNGKFLRWNRNFEIVTGYSAEEVAQLSPLDFFLGDGRILIQERIQEVFSKGISQAEAELVSKTGRRIPYYFRGERMLNNGQPCLIGMGIDITERKQAEAATRQSNEQIANILSSISDAFFSLDEQLRVTYFNAAAERLLQRPREEVLGRSLFDVFPETKGSIFETNYSQALRDKKSMSFETYFDREPYRNWYDVRVYPQAAGISVYFQVITERKEAQAVLERLVAERTAKLTETVGELEHFSYTITHDMRAPLRAMQGFGHMLLSQCTDCMHLQNREFLRRIAESAERMDALITDALNYTKIVRKDFPLQPVNISRLLASMVESYPQFQWPKAEINIEADLPVVLGNEAGLTQCFSNLLSNAIKFVQPGQVPQVHVWAEHRGDYERLWFEDNGIGIAKRHQEQIFVMFQRLSRDYEGTGIGLALVNKAVERMQGKAGVESEEGQGSKFWIELKTCESLSQGKYGVSP